MIERFIIVGPSWKILGVCGELTRVHSRVLRVVCVRLPKKVASFYQLGCQIEQISNVDTCRRRDDFWSCPEWQLIVAVVWANQGSYPYRVRMPYQQQSISFTGEFSFGTAIASRLGLITLDTALSEMVSTVSESLDRWTLLTCR